MRHITIAGILALALLVPLVAQAEDDAGKKNSEDLFLGRNLLFHITVDAPGFTHSIEFMSASDYFKFERDVAGWRLWGRGWLKPVRDAYLVQTDLGVNPARGSGKEKKLDGEFQVAASALVEVGQEVVVGRSGDLTIKLKVTEVR
jgi:hypothetical protein